MAAPMSVRFPQPQVSPPDVFTTQLLSTTVRHVDTAEALSSPSNDGPFRISYTMGPNAAPSQRCVWPPYGIAKNKDTGIRVD